MRRIHAFVFTLLAVLVLQNAAFSQERTRSQILKSASLQQAAFEKKTAQELIRLSAEKGWPLTLTGKNGKFALLTGVDVLGYPIYTATDNNIRSAATIRTNLLWPGGSTGLALSGSDDAVKGKLAIWDGGSIRGTHIELTGRVTQKDAPASMSDHATHVAGTMIAAGVNPVAKGMAFGMKELIAYDFNNHLSEMMSEAPNLLVSNHSYGAIAGWYYNDAQSRWEFWGQSGTTEDYKFGYYSSETQVFDSIAYNAPYYLIVKSAGNNRDENGPAVGSNYWRYNASGVMADAGNRPAGISNNDGYDIISTYGTAKNILTVGAVNPIDAGYTRPEDVVMTSFSSWGPTDDGRIKPDVVTDGVNLISPIATADNAYANYSGTSMASPGASGSAILLQEYYKRLHPAGFLRSSSLKGIIIHTADEAGTSPGPDYQFGWGLMNMEKAASVITDDTAASQKKQVILENTLTNGGSFSFPVIASGDGTLKATLCWTDPKGNVDNVNLLNNTALKLVHDLDLRIVKGATTYMPWVLNPASPSAAATTGDNTRDNVEKVEVPDFVPGEAYTIQVSHKGTLARGSQVYSLIISGIGGTAYCASGATSSAGARIDSVSFGTLQKGNPAGCTTYNNFTAYTAGAEVNASVPFYIKVSSCDASANNKIVKAYIDFNNDGDFNDAGELIGTSPVISGSGSFSGNAVIPATAKIGHYSLLRIIVQETSNAASITPCGTYSNGETEDFRVQFTNPSNDVGAVSVTNPLSGDCADGTQYVSVQLQNFGKIAQTTIPVTVTVKDGATTVATINETYPGTLAEYSTAVFTLQTPFISVAGKTYTITASTGLANDQDNSNNQSVSTVVVSPAGSTPSGQAEICGTSNVFLKVNSPVTGNLYSWYSTSTATTPIAQGFNTSSSVITSNQTYYLSSNDPGSSVGPADKMVFTDGGYNAFSGNFVKFTNNVPVLIKTVRLYIGNPGKINFIVADISNFDASTGSFSYLPLASTTIDVYASDPTPQAGAQTGNDAADLGNIYTLDLPVTTTGNHAIIVQCQNGATIFRNNNIATNPYPYSIPGVFAITGNSAVNTAVTPPDTTYYKKFYYFFYDMKIGIEGCPSAKATIVASTAPVPTITVSTNTLTSSPSLNYQWYKDGNLIVGATNQTYDATQSGVYKVTTYDAFGCQQTSADFNFTITGIAELNAGEIGLKALPNPNNGSFVLEFEMKKKSDMVVSLLNVTGQEVFRKSYPDFIGKYAEQVNAGKVSSGVYMVRIEHGGKTYLKKIIINK